MLDILDLDFGIDPALDLDRLGRAIGIGDVAGHERKRFQIAVKAVDADGFIPGQVQRLAVHPNFQRRGDATSLVQNSLSWIHSHGCRSTVVNTEVSNAAALSIYEHNGFVPLDYTLSVMERQLSV